MKQKRRRSRTLTEKLKAADKRRKDFHQVTKRILECAPILRGGK